MQYVRRKVVYVRRKVLRGRRKVVCNVCVGFFVLGITFCVANPVQ